MIYLKKINESNSDKIDEVRQFCKDNLAYLIDEGYYLLYSTVSSFEEFKNDKSVKCGISLHKYSGFMRWDEVSSDFIPFLQVLDDKYGLVKLEPTSKRDKYSKKCSVIFNDYKQSYRYSLNDLIDDRTNGISDKKLEYIGFSIKI
jgi:hypothetical protein